MSKAKMIRKGPIKPPVKKKYVIRPLTHNPFKVALAGLVVSPKGKGEVKA